jgi:hypothetical protein
VQRRRQAVADHLLFLQVLEGGVQPLEPVEIVEHGLDGLIDRLLVGRPAETKVAFTPKVVVSSSLPVYMPPGIVALA